jgi:hypothetical protein
MSRSTQLAWILVLCGGMAAVSDAAAVRVMEMELRVLCEPSLPSPWSWNRHAAEQVVCRRWAMYRQGLVGLWLAPLAIWWIADCRQTAGGRLSTDRDESPGAA